MALSLVPACVHQVCVRACVRACVLACMCACNVRVCVLSYAAVLVCLHMFVRVCCVFACLRACLRACVRVCCVSGSVAMYLKSNSRI